MRGSVTSRPRELRRLHRPPRGPIAPSIPVAKAGSDLPQVFVQPLRRDVQLDAAIGTRVRQSGLWPERRLILHPERVLAFDDNIRASVGIAVDDAHFLDDVARLV